MKIFINVEWNAPGGNIPFFTISIDFKKKARHGNSYLHSMIASILLLRSTIVGIAPSILLRDTKLHTYFV